MPKPTPPKAPAYVIQFIEAVCPEAPALYAASFNEKTCLEDATAIITRYRAALVQIVRWQEGSVGTMRQDTTTLNYAKEALR